MWNFESATVKKYFGANLKKAKANHDKELKKTKDKFVKDYPYAKLSQFEFWINLSKNGEISSKTNVVSSIIQADRAPFLRRSEEE